MNNGKNGNCGNREAKQEPAAAGTWGRRFPGTGQTGEAHREQPQKYGKTWPETGACRGKCPEPEGTQAEESRKALDKGLYYLQFSAKTEAELQKKLMEQGFSSAAVNDAAAALRAYHYLDDEDYARRYVERSGSRKSEKQLRFELQKKGVAREWIDRALAESPLDEEARILALLRKRRFSGKQADREERQKQAAYLARKGFSCEAVRAAMEHFCMEETE